MTTRTFPLQTNGQRSYIRLTKVLDFFEPEIFGGNLKSNRARQMASVQYGSQAPITDDIPVNHNFFRTRKCGVVTKFLDDHKLEKGSLIKIERLAPYTYRFTPG